MTAPPTHQLPFDYIHLLDAHISSLPANSHRIPQQIALRAVHSAKFYSPSQHIASPQLFSVISSPSTLTIGSPYIITMTLRHVENPAGNPNSLPVVFDLREFGLTFSEKETSKMGNWILLRKRSSGSTEDRRQIEGEEIDLSPSNPTPTEFGFPIFSADSNFELNDMQLGVIEREDEEFISLGVGESKTFKVNWALSEEQEEKLEVGEKYKLCYKGGWNFWWDFGTVEEMEEQEGRRNTWRNMKKGEKRLWIPCTNLVEFEVQDKGE
ncbi:uncharacterized protein Bfra_007132 [Botrytis fragariae]|uniref:Uncharacterized protein n=1 Tax=Botrytis fragariae TaxID=1964551 RepID=A0A8H6AHX5_9HELO|nr:uncharacterized protein Bfra_007132 [Botrytis fragariae]KAF5867937.1 hypothetical protein Bfra_007132 [Botrytis fragariae]